MAELTDHELLTAFARTGTESAFATLVQRHINLVYSTAKRFTDDDTLAGDITQAVFILLARKAGGISAKTILTGWLYQTARLLAANALKQNIRRQNREQEAYMQSTLNQNDTDAAWKQIAPVLDDAMGALGETDRNAVLLRYFESKPLAEVGLALGVSEDAARVRVNRALEKLRTLMTRKGVTLGATTIAGAVTAKAVTAAPVTLASTITTAALSGTTLTLATITMTTFQKIAVTAALTLSVGAGIFEAKQAHDARNDVAKLQAQQAPTQEQIRQLQNDLSHASNTITGLNEDFTKNQKDNSELLKLRGQAAVLQSEKEKLAAELKDAEADDAHMADVMSNTPPVRTFVKTISCRVKSGDGVVFGGWQTAAGKRTFVVVTPQLGTDNGTITAKSKVVEMSEGAAAQSGFSNLYSTNVYSKGNIVQRPQKVSLTFSANDLQGIMQQVSTSEGFKNVAEPQIQVADGRLADVLVGETRQTASGEPYSIGPEINVVPSVMPDGTTISLFLTAQVNVPIDF